MRSTDRAAPGRARGSLAAACAYLAVSVAFFGVPVLRHPGRDLIGSGLDPQIFVWSLGWWPHAILHGLNPVVTRELWAPVGTNLAWSTAVPGLALLLSPVTLAAGPVVAYNVAAILLPALAAWTAFLLCRRITGATWPSLAGGYLFGFSSYLLGHELGHLHLTSVFGVPLVCLALLRWADGDLDRRGLAVRLGPLLALQLSFGIEVFFTLSLMLVLGLALAYLTVPDRRARLRGAALPVAGSYLACLVLTAPLVYYTLSDFHRETITPTDHDPADLLTFVAPTRVTAVLGQFWDHFDPSVPPVSAEAGQYLGLPAVAIAAAVAWRLRGRPGVRFLTAGTIATAVLTLGSTLRVRGHAILPLPWRLVSGLPVFDNVIPGRFVLYVSLGVAVLVALWAAAPGRGRAVRIGLTAAALVAILPNLSLGIWHLHPARAAFFTDGLYRACLRPGETVLVLSNSAHSQALLWQAESGYRFRLAAAGLNADIPANLPDRAVTERLIGNMGPVTRDRGFVALARAQGITALIVDRTIERGWEQMLDRSLHKVAGAGVALYPLRPALPGCTLRPPP